MAMAIMRWRCEIAAEGGWGNRRLEMLAGKVARVETVGGGGGDGSVGKKGFCGVYGLAEKGYLG